MLECSTAEHFPSGKCWKGRPCVKKAINTHCVAADVHAVERGHWGQRGQAAVQGPQPELRWGKVTEPWNVKEQMTAESN